MSLSDKEMVGYLDMEYQEFLFKSEDVKKAVQELKEGLPDWKLIRGDLVFDCHEIIDKIFGEKLT